MMIQNLLRKNIMAEETTTPTARPARASYATNNGFAQLLRDAALVNDAASEAAFKDALKARLITPAFVVEQGNLIVQATRLMQSAEAGRNTAHNSTSQKMAKRAGLERLLGQVQAAALQRDLMDGGDRAATYYVGSDISGANAAQLRVIAEGTADQLTRDDLPGVSPDDEKLLSAALNEWETESQSQQEAKTGALQAQDELESLIERIKRNRQITQLAADAEYPYQNYQNGLIRQRFGLSTDRPYRPRRNKGKA